MLWVVSYDIANDKRRYRVCKVLEGYGRRAQYSVFECDISDEQRKRLEAALRREIDPDEDDVRFYPLNRADLKRIVILGKAKVYQKQEFYDVKNP